MDSLNKVYTNQTIKIINYSNINGFFFFVMKYLQINDSQPDERNPLLVPCPSRSRQRHRGLERPRNENRSVILPFLY